MNQEEEKEKQIKQGLNKLKELRNINQTTPGNNEEEDYFDALIDQYGTRTYRIKNDDEWRAEFEIKWGRRGGKKKSRKSRKSRNRKRNRRTRRR